MVVNNCKNVENYVWSMKKKLLKIVINNRVLLVFMVVNSCKKIEDYVSALKKWVCCIGD